MPASLALPRPFFRVLEELVPLVAAAFAPKEMAAAHQAFEQRTGAFGPDDAWFESRSRAFWDDLLTRHPATRPLLNAFDGEGQHWVRSLQRGHRGLFQSRPQDGGFVLLDVVTGAEFFVREIDDGSRDGLASTTGFFDGTVVGVASPVQLALLPGAIFHPEEAESAIRRVVGAAATRGLAPGTLLDSLLRMELSLRVLSRVKPGYTYRPEALPV